MSEHKPSSGGGMWTRVGSAAAAKVLVMGFNGLIGIFTTRLIIQSFGLAAYGQYGLLATLPNLLPFVDLGMAAVIFNAIASSNDPHRDEQVSRTIMTAVRILLGSGLAIALVSLLITAGGVWPTILGAGLMPGADIVPLICFGIWAAALPLSIGTRVLIGLGRTTTQIAITGITGPFMITNVFLLATFAPQAGSYLAIVSYAASACVSLVSLVVAARAITPQIGQALRRVPQRRRYPGVRAIHVAGPMLLQSLVLPLGMQTDRLLISHLTRGTELAQYNLGAQLFGLLLQTIAASGVALWPIFAKARSRRQLLSPVRPMIVFLAAGLVAGGAMALVSPWLVQFVVGDRFTLSPWLIGGFIAYVAVDAAKYPVGMYLTDEKGLKFQMLPILVPVPVNITLSWILTLQLGAAGPVIGTATSVLLCQVIPYLLYVLRDLRRRTGESPVADPDSASGHDDVVS